MDRRHKLIVLLADHPTLGTKGDEVDAEIGEASHLICHKLARWAAGTGRDEGAIPFPSRENQAQTRGNHRCRRRLTY